MKRMSFGLTTSQFLDGSKTVTRRLGWWHLRPGDRVLAVEKAMGLRKGEHQRVLGEIVIVSALGERLDDIGREDCAREGFPGMSPAEFVRMFCGAMRCRPSDAVNRIEFKRSPGDTVNAGPELQVPEA